jgi:hypothetical protein
MRNTTIRFKHTESDIRAAAAKSFSVRGTAIALGIRPHGGSLGSLKKRLVNLGVDTSHFTGQRGGGCGHGPLGTIIPASVRLVLRPAGSNRERVMYYVVVCSRSGGNIGAKLAASYQYGIVSR